MLYQNKMKFYILGQKTDIIVQQKKRFHIVSYHYMAVVVWNWWLTNLHHTALSITFLRETRGEYILKRKIAQGLR